MYKAAKFTHSINGVWQAEVERLRQARKKKEHEAQAEVERLRLERKKKEEEAQREKERLGNLVSQTSENEIQFSFFFFCLPI